ncbi:hypothetical protein FW778_05410 [Ginsengibacter hankyongi]|uniref:Uncharacterized protein n=1 Tax=Ginsengibacter hankyongi TaxID=2607284 RepID=A0A5J5IM88_9BACT|nr:hypothetical protein [Ginsengibacter hankyongi]KAA9041463.1 hypothetical protein FW778_05410 [Ginsengibacter hankyongi]
MRIKHFGVFKNQMKALDWEILRNDQTEGPYYLPYQKKDYLLRVEATEPSLSTKIILQEIERIGLKKVFSIGSGIAIQEYQLKKFSKCKVVVTDYNPSVMRLKQFQIFDDAFILDAFKDPLPVDKSWVVLFPRIDTEFDDFQLNELFEKCHKSGINSICFIPAELLSFRIILAEIKTFVISMIKGKPRVFCGYARTLGSFRKLWDPYYILARKFKTDKAIFFLQAK